MILDAQNRFSNAQAVTATAVSADIIDLTDLERRIGTGRNLYIVVGVDIAFTDAGSDSTIQVELQSDALEAFGSATNRQDLGTFAALSAVGTQLLARIAPEILTERFIRLNYTVANGNLTTGSLTSFIALDIDAFTAYPSGFTIS